MPVFWLAIILIELFAVQFRWFPSSAIFHRSAARTTCSTGLWHLVLPVVAIALASFVSWMRYQRSSIIEAMNSAYIRTARSKGLSSATSSCATRSVTRSCRSSRCSGSASPQLVGGAYFVEYVRSRFPASATWTSLVDLLAAIIRTLMAISDVDRGADRGRQPARRRLLCARRSADPVRLMRTFRRFLRERPAVIGSSFVLLLILVAIFGP